MRVHGSGGSHHDNSGRGEAVSEDVMRHWQLYVSYQRQTVLLGVHGQRELVRCLNDQDGYAHSGSEAEITKHRLP